MTMGQDITATLPSSLGVSNYRSFLGEHEFELKPLTLIYGANNVGKSALVRLLPLLGDSVAADATGALRLESAAACGAGFGDLESKVPGSAPVPLSVALRWASGPVNEAIFVFERRDREGVVILELEVTLRDGSSHQFTRGPHRVRSDTFVHEYKLRTPAGQQRLEVSFRGLVPSEGVDNIPLAQLRAALLPLRGSVQWLRAQRAIPGRLFVKPSGPVPLLFPDGSNVPAALWNDRALADSVSSWFKYALGRALRLNEASSDEFRFQLENAIHTSNVQVDLIDSGNGPSQVLPVIAACALAARANGPRIVAIEEPDANLDVSSQRRLAEYLVGTAAAPSRPRLLIETHSQALLLGVQLAVAKGAYKLAPEDVAIYWVEQDEFAHSMISPVTIDADGRLSGNWPDPFGEIRSLARELVALRMERNTG